MFGCVDKTGAARIKPHARMRTPGALNCASRKRHHDTAVIGRGPADVLKKDTTRHVEKIEHAWPKELMAEARRRGVSVKTLIALARLDAAIKAGKI